MSDKLYVPSIDYPYFADFTNFYDKITGKILDKRVILDKVLPDIDFTDEAVLQFGVPVVKILL